MEFSIDRFGGDYRSWDDRNNNDLAEPGDGPVPRVSIGVPVFNGERYVARTLDALLGQTFGDFELIPVCDAPDAPETETQDAPEEAP